MQPTSDEPPAARGLFRSWPRIYAAVLCTALAVYVFLFVFSRAFAP